MSLRFIHADDDDYTAALSRSARDGALAASSESTFPFGGDASFHSLPHITEVDERDYARKQDMFWQYDDRDEEAAIGRPVHGPRGCGGCQPRYVRSRGGIRAYDPSTNEAMPLDGVRIYQLLQGLPEEFCRWLSIDPILSHPKRYMWIVAVCGPGLTHISVDRHEDNTRRPGGGIANKMRSSTVEPTSAERTVVLRMANRLKALESNPPPGVRTVRHVLSAAACHRRSPGDKDKKKNKDDRAQVQAGGGVGGGVGGGGEVPSASVESHQAVHATVRPEDARMEPRETEETETQPTGLSTSTSETETQAARVIADTDRGGELWSESEKLSLSMIADTDADVRKWAREGIRGDSGETSGVQIGLAGDRTGSSSSTQGGEFIESAGESAESAASAESLLAQAHQLWASDFATTVSRLTPAVWKRQVAEARDELQYALDSIIRRDANPTGRHGAIMAGHGGRGLNMTMRRFQSSQRGALTQTEKLVGKGGRFGGNVKGKRVDFSGRAVNDVAPELPTNAAELPVMVMMQHYDETPVTEYTIAALMHSVHTGPFVHPGANMIKHADGNLYNLRFLRNRRALPLRLGMTVDRQLRGQRYEALTGRRRMADARGGDRYIFNRAPTLHALGMQEHIAVERNWGYRRPNVEVARVNPCSFPPYRADADGDAWSLMAPVGSPAASVEVERMDVNNNVKQPSDGSPCIVPAQDYPLATFLATEPGVSFEYARAVQILGARGLHDPVVFASAIAPTFWVPVSHHIDDDDDHDHDQDHSRHESEGVSGRRGAYGGDDDDTEDDGDKQIHDVDDMDDTNDTNDTDDTDETVDTNDTNVDMSVAGHRSTKTMMMQRYRHGMVVWAMMFVTTAMVVMLTAPSSTVTWIVTKTLKKASTNTTNTQKASASTTTKTVHSNQPVLRE